MGVPKEGTSEEGASCCSNSPGTADHGHDLEDVAGWEVLQGHRQWRDAERKKKKYEYEKKRLKKLSREYGSEELRRMVRGVLGREETILST